MTQLTMEAVFSTLIASSYAKVAIVSVYKQLLPLRLSLPYAGRELHEGKDSQIHESFKKLLSPSQNFYLNTFMNAIIKFLDWLNVKAFPWSERQVLFAKYFFCVSFLYGIYNGLYAAVSSYC